MKVKPQKSSSEIKYPRVNRIAKKCAIVAAGAAVASTVLGFVWYSDMPVVRSVREDYSLSEIFPENGVLRINGSDNNTVNYTVIRYSDPDYQKACQYRNGCQLFVQGISIVRFYNITSEELLKDEYIQSLLEDYDLLSVTSGCVLVPKNDDGYFVAYPEEHEAKGCYAGGMNYTDDLHDYDYIN